jgi:hypothetical protein
MFIDRNRGVLLDPEERFPFANAVPIDDSSTINLPHRATFIGLTTLIVDQTALDLVDRDVPASGNGVT